MAIEDAGVEKSGIVVFFYKCMGYLGDENTALLSGSVRVFVIKISGAQRAHHRRMNWKGCR